MPIPPDLPFAEKAITILRDYVDTRHNGSVRAAAIALGLDGESGLLNKWLRVGKRAGARYPGLERLGPVLDALGAKLVGPDERFVPAAGGPGREALELIETLRRERDEARGACAVLERMLERQTERLAEKRGEGPAPSSLSRQGR